MREKKVKKKVTDGRINKRNKIIRDIGDKEEARKREM